MSSKAGGEQGRRTFIEEARRAQIVQAAIETVAEFGYANTSFSKIAKRAGLSSTGLISYYFEGKSTLFEEVMYTVFRTGSELIAPAMEREQTFRGKLRAYIEASVEFMVKYPAHTMALVEIVVGTCYRESGSPREEGAPAPVDPLEDCLIRGRAAGEFGDFDPHVMAIAIRGAIDNTLRQSMLDPSIELEQYRRQLADIFDICTRPSS